MSDCIQGAFPHDEIEALALLYVRQKGELSPSVMFELYQKAYQEITLRQKEAQRKQFIQGSSAK